MFINHQNYCCKDLSKKLNAFGFKFILIKRIHHTIYIFRSMVKNDREKEKNDRQSNSNAEQVNMFQ